MTNQPKGQIKWDAEKKQWVSAVRKSAYQITAEKESSTNHSNETKLCPYCHTYCDGDCRAH